MTLLTIPSAFITGLATSAGLIMAIGAQNAFVLSQGLRREYHWTIAGVCSLLDALLISLGVAGMGVLINNSPLILNIATYGGALFLFAYGALALRSALNPDTLRAEKGALGSLRAAIVTTLALSLLNPHVYLDTVVLLGSIGGRYPAEEQLWFASGAAGFSLIWFFSLATAARWLAPLFTKPSAWRVLDGIVCITMWTLCGLLLSGQL